MGIDLLEKMLKYDPDERITAEDALKHPYMAEYHFPDDEPTTIPVSQFDFDFEKYMLKKSEYRDLMYDEVQLYHSEEAVNTYMAEK